MKKFALIALAAGLAGSVSACGTITQTGLCDDQQTIGCAPYTDERTVLARPKSPVPEVTVTPEPAPEPIVETVIDDTPVIQSAEPQFKHISK